MTGRFALLASAFLLIFTLAAPLYLDNARVLAVAGLVAHAAAFLLNVFGASATATASLLTTPRGAFLVTQECISTPLIPVYLAAVVVYPRTWSSRVVWLAAALPLFVALGVLRLLVVALPAGLEPSPLFLIHAFSQVLIGAAMVCGLALWRHGARAATFVRAAVALAIAFGFMRWLGAPYSHVILGLPATAIVFDDSQGALLFLPAFQCGLFLALWVAGYASTGWRRALCGVSLLAVMQVVVAAGVHLLVLRGGIVPLVRDIRAWALLGPALVIFAVARGGTAMVNVGQTRR